MEGQLEGEVRGDRWGVSGAGVRVEEVWGVRGDKRRSPHGIRDVAKLWEEGLGRGRGLGWSALRSPNHTRLRTRSAVQPSDSVANRNSLSSLLCFPAKHRTTVIPCAVSSTLLASHLNPESMRKAYV